MSDAADKLARTRLAIIAHVQRREHRRDEARRDEGESPASTIATGRPRPGIASRRRGPVRPLQAHGRHLVAASPGPHGPGLATPLLSDYAARKPVQYLGIAALIGAASWWLRDRGV